MDGRSFSIVFQVDPKIVQLPAVKLVPDRSFPPPIDLGMEMINGGTFSDSELDIVRGGDIQDED